MSEHHFNIERIAHLACIELSKEEKSRFEKELESILSFIDQLNEVDVTSVEPVAHISGLSDTAREDEKNIQWGEGINNVLLAQAPKTESSFIKVKTVLEK